MAKKTPWRDIPALFYSHPLRRRAFFHVFKNLRGPIRLMTRLYRATLIRQARLAAITGSYGKTTTMRALTVALGGRIHRYSAFNAGFFLDWALLRVPPGAKHGVVEIGIHGLGQMEKAARLIRPTIAVATAIGTEHITSFKTVEATRHEKAFLIRSLPEASGLAVLNGDDPNVQWMASQTKARVVTYGFGESNDVRAEAFALDWPNGSRILVNAGGERRELRVCLLGRSSAYPILAAVAVARAEGFGLAEIASRLEVLAPAVGRLETVPLPGGAHLVRDDFKGALETIENALRVMQEIPARRKIAILGRVSETPGSVGETCRNLGALAAQSVNQVIFLGNRKEISPFRAGAKSAGMAPEDISVVIEGHGFLEALDYLPRPLGHGDVVLIKGRGAQKLGRLALALTGRRVRCAIPECPTYYVQCARCKMLERGWGNRRVVL